jgi:hypothetical protein
MTIALIVHGGAQEIAPDELAACRSGCLAVLQRFAQRLIPTNVATEGSHRSMPSQSFCKTL